MRRTILKNVPRSLTSISRPENVRTSTSINSTLRKSPSLDASITGGRNPIEIRNLKPTSQSLVGEEQSLIKFSLPTMKVRLVKRLLT